MADAAPDRSDRRWPAYRLYNKCPRGMKKVDICGMDAATLRPHVVGRPELLSRFPYFMLPWRVAKHFYLPTRLTAVVFVLHSAWLPSREHLHHQMLD